MQRYWIMFWVLPTVLRVPGHVARAQDAPPARAKFHYEDDALWVSMAATWLPAGDEFHMYYAVKPEEGGSVAHVTTPDLVHWERQEPVIHPDEGCRFDGGSVIEHEGELAMYYSHRCCELYDCPTAIRRATSTDGFVWTAREEPLLRFDAAPFLTYPYVVYEAARGRFVMVMGTGELPDRLHFYHSTDGIAWVAGGNKPSAADATGRHYLTHIGGESWMLRYRELYDIGTLNDDAVFEIDVSEGRTGTNAAPVYGHPDFDQVEMARTVWNRSMGPTHPGDYPHCDWLPAVSCPFRRGGSKGPRTRDGQTASGAPTFLVNLRDDRQAGQGAEAGAGEMPIGRTRLKRSHRGVPIGSVRQS
eukprot:Polyplicarium_translucidae@DN2760_c0_g2_i1.p1